MAVADAGAVSAVTSKDPQVVEGHRAGDDEGLAGLQAVDAGQDVDGVGAEDDQHHHEHLAARELPAWVRRLVLSRTRAQWLCTAGCSVIPGRPVAARA